MDQQQHSRFFVRHSVPFRIRIVSDVSLANARTMVVETTKRKVCGRRRGLLKPTIPLCRSF